jgi:hypothetical protein
LLVIAFAVVAMAVVGLAAAGPSSDWALLNG